MSYRRAMSSELASPPVSPVRWVIFPLQGLDGPWSAVAQTAHRAWQLSGCPLHYSAVKVVLADSACALWSALYRADDVAGGA